MKKTLIGLFVLFALTSIIVLATEIPEGKEVFTFDAKLGTVTFKHAEHAERIGNCTQCHHKFEGEDLPKACSTCHDPKEIVNEAPKLKNAMHDNCQGCHQEKIDAGEKAGPVKGAKECKKCHIKSAS